VREMDAYEFPVPHRNFPDDQPSEIADKLGIEVADIRLVAQGPVGGIVAFLRKYPCDLIVLSTRGGEGFERWLTGSVAEAVSRRAATPALFVARGARGFVNQISGDIQLRRVLVPVDFSPAPSKALEAIRWFTRLMTGADLTVHVLHVGSSAPPLCVASSDQTPPPIILRSGSVSHSIIDAAVEFEVDLIAMPTAGHRGLLDVLRGSTTERVVRHAPCPVLALPSA
jgi:nucleotide-binding universal stress UspA family protein